MSGAKSGNNDPSMDDILASIRKIISDDEARAQVNSQAGGNTAPASGANSTPQGAEAAPVNTTNRFVEGLGEASGAHAAAPSQRDDVLLLTDLIEEPKSAPVNPAVTPAPPPVQEPAFDPPSITPASVAAMSQPSPDPVPSNDQSLVGASVAGAASSAFDRLSQAVQESVPHPSAPDPGPTLGSGRSLEDIVKEMLRPMLKEWLDRNLPPMVERFVEREIVRLTRR
jgi:cell pole-organizing protein PopZ